MLKVADISAILGYGMSGVMGIIGVLVLSGILVREGMPMHLRVLFGVVLILYSVYRFMMTRARSRQVESSDE